MNLNSAPSHASGRIHHDTLLASLNWRYATKIFDPTRKIPDDDWATLEKALILSPSAFGLQPWKFVVVTDAATRKDLLPVSWGQRQIFDASHLVVFAAKIKVSAEDIDAYIANIASTRGVPLASLDGYKNVMTGAIMNPSFPMAGWVANQAYIALGNLLTSASLLGIDACPMEGFSPDKYDEILGLTPLGFRAVVVCALGYRSATDPYASLPKVRAPSSELVLNV